MRLVVDANILFSALIKDGFTAKLFFKDNLYLYTPEFIIEEFEKYEHLILKKTKRSPEEFKDIMVMFREIVTVVPEDEYSKFMECAEGISPDEKDFAYFALAIRLKCPIWSNDKALKNQNSVKVFSTVEVKGMV